MAKPTAEHTVIGFIGLGAIGRPVAERLVAGAVPVVVYNRTRAAATPFEGRAEIVATPAEVADKADLVFACLTDGASYRDVLFGTHGVVRGNRARAYIHTGTNNAGLVKELELALRRHDIAMLDAPMTGGVSGAANGTLTVMVSGPADLFERSQPYLRQYARHIVYLGEEIGAAQTLKLINNALSAANLALACEALVLGSKAGLDPKAMLEVINHGTGQSNATLTKIPAQVLTGRFKQGVSIGATLEILEEFRAEARQYHVPIPLAEAVIDSLRSAALEEGEGADLTLLIRPMERAAGATLNSSGRHDALLRTRRIQPETGR